MSTTTKVPSVVRVNADMTLEERRAAANALAKGVRAIEMPASWEILHDQAVHVDDKWPFQGTITFDARAGGVSAQRLPAERGGGFPASRNFLKYGSSFSGSVDPATRVIRGTVTSDLKHLNSAYAVGSVLAGAILGAFIGIGTRQWWVFVMVAVASSLALLRLNIITNRREAKLLVPDLERIAALAAGKKPVHRQVYNGSAVKG